MPITLSRDTFTSFLTETVSIPGTVIWGEDDVPVYGEPVTFAARIRPLMPRERMTAGQRSSDWDHVLYAGAGAPVQAGSAVTDADGTVYRVIDVVEPSHAGFHIEAHMQVEG